MPRPLRIFLKDISLHVIQRGNNRMSIFHDDHDYMSFLGFLEWTAARHAVAVHGFALMTNHIHFIATPVDANGLPRMMKEIGTRYGRYYNQKYDRIGTLWNGRYRGLLIQDERYWLTCLRYIEQNPVRAGIVAMPGAYRWSSYQTHALGSGPDWLAPHGVYLGLGADPEERQVAYRKLCGELLGTDQLAVVRCTPPRRIARTESDTHLTPI